jgi:uncharacterized protein DUF4166
MRGDANPYRAVLGPAFSSLHANVQRAHVAPLVASGTVDVERGSHWLTPLLARAMTLPHAGLVQPVQLHVVNDGRDMRWLRVVGDVPLHTRQRAERGHIVERQGAGRIAFRLDVHDGALVYQQRGIRVAGVPLPAFLTPRVSATVSPDGDGWEIDVIVTWRGALVCRYAGKIRAT